MEEYKMLLLVFIINIFFMIFILIFFHYFRQHKGDKLISIFSLILAQKFNTNYYEEDEEEKKKRDKDENELTEIFNMDSNRDSRRPSKVLFKKAKEVIKDLKKKSKDNSFFGWYKFVYDITDRQVFCLCNGDGLVYLYFLRTTGLFFMILSVISIFFMLPLFSIKEEVSKLKPLSQLTVLNITDDSTKVSIVLIFSMVYVLFAHYHVYNLRKHMKKVNKRTQFVDSIDSDLSLHTLHIRGLARNLGFYEAQKVLKSFFDVLWADQVSQIHVITNYDRLMDLINDKFNLETAYNQFKQKNLSYNKRIKSKVGDIYVDAEIYHENLIKINGNLLNFYRKLNSNSNTGNAFISFRDSSIVTRILENKRKIYEKENTFHGKILNIKVISLYIRDWLLTQAPTPSDIIWENVKYSKQGRILRMILYTMILFLVSMVIVTPVRIRNELKPLIDNIAENFQKENLIRIIIEQYTLPLIVVLMNSLLLPFIVFWISYFERHYKRSYREKSILVKSFTFMLINSLFIPTFGLGDIVNFFKNLFQKDLTEWNSFLSEKIFGNNYFFMRYIIQVAFLSNSIQLLALPQYLVRRIRRCLAKTKFEEFNANLIKKYFDYGFNYSFSITVFVMTLVFSTSIPLMLPFGCLFFYFKYFVDKYNLLFVYPVEFESHGNIGSFVIKFLLFGIFLFQFIISGLFEYLLPREYCFVVSVLYLIIASLMYFVGRNYLFQRVGEEYARPSFFEFFKNNTSTMLNSIFNPREHSLIQRTSNLGNSPAFEKIIKDAYVHPAEKEYINNPIMIWNDSYSFVKNTRFKSQDPNEFVEYEMLIKRASTKSFRNNNSLNDLKKRLTEDFTVE